MALSELRSIFRNLKAKEKDLKRVNPLSPIHPQKFTISIKMTGTSWSSEEISLLLFLSSRGIRHEIIADMLSNRLVTFLVMPGAADAPQRTVSAVRGKLAWLRAHHPELWLDDGRMDITAMMDFVYSLPFVDPVQLNMLFHQATIAVSAIH